MTAPDGSVPSGAYTGNTDSTNISNLQAVTQASAESIMSGGAVTAYGGAATNTGNFVQASADLTEANLVDAVANIQILGLEPFQFLTPWATSLKQQAADALTGSTAANNSVATISTGVTNNITGAAATSSANGVGPAVQLLNATVQASGNAPRVDIYNTSATWVQHTGMTTAQVIGMAGGGGGAQGGTSFAGTGAAGGGGGAGGYSVWSGLTAASLPSSAPVVVPQGGTGGGAASGQSYTDGFQRANSSVLGGMWRIDSGGQSNQIVSDIAEAFTPSGGGVGETGCWSTYTSPLSTDNWVVIAQLTAPTTSLATDNYTGVYGACATTFGTGTKLIAFVGNTSTGCGLISQTGAPAGPWTANGAATGQTILAQTTTTFSTTSQIALTRNGNVFTGWINGSAIVTWTDTGNTVPVGSGNRLCGFVTETNWPTFQPQYCSPALSSWTARDVSWNSQPGTAGGNASFNGSAYQVTGGAGGAGGGVDSGSTRRPATGSFLNTSATWTGAAGTGNQTNNAAGGVGAAGQTGFLPNGTAGGGGLNTGGGAAGTSTSLAGSPGTSPSGGVYGPGSGAGGGFYLPLGSTAIAGAGAAGGFPGGGGGGGGASLDGLGANGTGGPGGNGQVVVTSYF